MICLEIDYFKARIVQLFIMSKSMETDAELLMHGKHSNMACCLSNYGMQLSCIIKITVLIINIFGQHHLQYSVSIYKNKMLLGKVILPL